MVKTVKDAYGEILRLRNEFYKKWQEVPHEVYDENRNVYKAKYEAFDKALEILTPFIVDYQPEDSTNKNLEEEVEKYIKENGFDGLDTIEEVKYIARHFVNWQKEQINKNIPAWKSGIPPQKGWWLTRTEHKEGLVSVACVPFRDDGWPYRNVRNVLYMDMNDLKDLPKEE